MWFSFRSVGARRCIRNYDVIWARFSAQRSPHFFRGAICNWRWRFAAASSRMTKFLNRKFRAANCRERDRAMLNVGPSGLPFAPYEGQKASKLGRSRNEGIPEGFPATCALQRELKVEEGHLMPDHVHMLLSIPPKYAWRAQTKFRRATFLGPRILRKHGRAGRGCDPRLHPQPREGRPEARADESLALTNAQVAPNSRGRVSDPSYRFERFTA